MAGLAAASRVVAWAGLLLTSALPLRAVDWQVPDATLRFKVDLNRKPTHPSAGYFVQFPDGGLLHGTTPSTTVMTEDGKVLPSYLMWQNSDTGFSIVFADPGDLKKPVYVYNQTGRQPKLWAPATGLTPSTLLVSNPGRDSIKLAQDLAKLGHVDPDVRVENKAGIARAPLSIGGDDSGRPRPASFYMLAYLEAPEAGKYWIAPTIHEGLNEMQVDGAHINTKMKSKAWGGFGAMVDLTKGLHRVEIYQTEVPIGPPIPPQGLMFLTWRTPKEQFKEVESRVVRDNEIVRSGAGNVVGVEARDGTPAAAANASASLVYWFENEEPLLLYDLRALTAGQPAGTTYTWTFPEGATLEGEKVQWLFSGLREVKVKLTAKNGAKTSEVIVPFFTFGTGQTSLDNPKHRAFYRDTLATMLAAYPKTTPDPVNSWSDAWWNNLTRTIEGGEGEPVLRRLFTDHFDTTKHKLATDKLYALEDILLEFAQRANPKEALAWLQKFATGAADATRQNELKLRECEIQTYYLDDRKTAKATLTMLSGQLNQFGERAKIRLGDLAFLEGDLNAATKLYADVQNRARTARNLAAPPQIGLLGAAKPAATPAFGEKPRTLGALQEVSLSENVQTLTEKDFLIEAHQALLTWETEFPLSKITGDYILRESELAMKTQDWKRAQPMLETYCREVDASSFLPEAVSLLMRCVQGAKAPPASIKEILEKVKGRLKYHPVASEIDKFLGGK